MGAHGRRLLALVALLCGLAGSAWAGQPPGYPWSNPSAYVPVGTTAGTARDAAAAIAAETANATAASNAQTTANAAVPSTGGNASATLVTATGAAQPRTQAAIAADVQNVANFIMPGDADATAGFNRAVTQAIALGHPVQLTIPCGTYSLSGTISITTAASQGVLIEGARSGCVTITQNADADAFDISLTNYGGVFATGAARVSGIKFVMSATSSTRKAVSISSTAGTGAAGVPLYVSDLSFASGSSNQYWGTGLYINQIPNAVYLDHINSYYAGSPAGGTAISINGDTTAYTTSVFLRDTFLVGGTYGVNFGNYLQGVHLDNINTVGTAYAVYYNSTAGINEEVQIANSYLDGKTYLANTTPAALSQIKLSHVYFDSLNGLTSGQTLVSITGTNIISLDHDTYNGNSALTSLTGLSISGVSSGSVDHEKVEGFSDTGGVGIAVNNATYPIIFDGTYFSNNTTDVSDTSPIHNVWSNSVASSLSVLSLGQPSANGIFFQGGVAGSSLANIITQGADANIGVLWQVKGLPSLDYYFRDGNGNSILTLDDSQTTSDVGVYVLGKQTGVSPVIEAHGSTVNMMLGVSGALATTATGGMIQIPYMAGAPTGTPATTGGATEVYNTSTHTLNIYDPTAAGWYHVTLTAGAN